MTPTTGPKHRKRYKREGHQRDQSRNIEARPDVLEDESGEPAGGEGVLRTYVEPPAGSPDPV